MVNLISRQNTFEKMAKTVGFAQSMFYFLTKIRKITSMQEQLNAFQKENLFHKCEQLLILC
jgi:hypothetical protein